jgi:putative hydrolase of the HAD superfamily
MQLQAVIFDLDDTLYLERDYVRSGFRAVAEHLRRTLNRPESFEDWLWDYFLKTKTGWTYRKGFSGGAFDALNDAMQLGLGGADIDALVAVYRQHAPAIEANAEMVDLLGELRGRVKLGLLSDGFLPAQRLKIDALGIAGLFEATVITEELGREFWKPSPAGFELIAERLAVPHRACAYVGDNPSKDFVAPNALGWRSIQLVLGGQVHSHKKPPAGGEPWALVNSPAELRGLLLDQIG